MSDAAWIVSLVAKACWSEQDYKDWKTKHTEVHSDICSKNNLLLLQYCLGFTPSSILQSGCCIVFRILRHHSDKLTFDLQDKTSLNWIVFILSDTCVKTVSYWLYELLSEGQKTCFVRSQWPWSLTFDPPKSSKFNPLKGFLRSWGGWTDGQSEIIFVFVHCYHLQGKIKKRFKKV